MTTTLPSRLQTARTVGIYSPSGTFCDTEEKIQLFDAGKKRLEALGFDIVLSSHYASSWYHMSAPAADRVADLYALVDDANVDIILPTIGGHVAAQMLRLIDFDRIADSGKALFGFSDNSILPAITSARTGAVTFHTLCDVTFGFGRFGGDDYRLTETSFIKAVRDHTFDLAGTGRWQAVQAGSAEGVLLGGNLHSLCYLAGTPWWPDWRGKILFWEAGDALHTIAQDLVLLWNAGVFDGLAGMIIGRVSGLHEDFYREDQVMPLDKVLLDVIGLRGRFPIVWNADIGHDAENVTLPLGATVRLSAKADQIVCTVDLA